MKYLRANDSIGEYSVDGSTWMPIDKITKEVIMQMIDFAVNGEFELDALPPGGIKNSAHHIIYKSISEKMSALLANKRRFKDESENMFKFAFDKYKQLDQT